MSTAATSPLSCANTGAGVTEKPPITAAMDSARAPCLRAASGRVLVVMEYSPKWWQEGAWANPHRSGRGARCHRPQVRIGVVMGGGPQPGLPPPGGGRGVMAVRESLRWSGVDSFNDFC